MAPHEVKTTYRRRCVWQALVAYGVLFLVGIGFYAGSRILEFMSHPAATAWSVGVNVAAAFLVGLVFGLFGGLCALTTFLINDTSH